MHILAVMLELKQMRSAPRAPVCHVQRSRTALPEFDVSNLAVGNIYKWLFKSALEKSGQKNLKKMVNSLQKCQKRQISCSEASKNAHLGRVTGAKANKNCNFSTGSETFELPGERVITGFVHFGSWEDL